MSANPQSAKTNNQVRAIYGLARKRDLDTVALHQLVREATGKDSIAALNVTQADAVIVRLGGQPLAARRTIQHRRRRAGVSQVAQPAHLDLMRRLARQRNMSDEGLQQLTTRICKHFPPRTTHDTNKVIEALKAMNRRDG